MPQMAPMWWDILYIIFIILFLLINMIIYFNKNLKINYKMINKLNNEEIKWKW
uniref:ATP synthase complex subunit 8 n=1 Tax=Megalotomus costalis TaxID=763254 RepID=A0A8K1VL42_9HEMI|nr:ATP synthase F0 subunit 8 [Megalotomus costalis]